MFNDQNWFFTDDPNLMWGRQLEYREIKSGREQEHYIVTPDRRRFSDLRHAFSFYRVGLGDRGPGDEQLEVMRRTMNWIHCRRYEQPVVARGSKCPSTKGLARIDDRRIICDVFGGSRPLFEHYLLHLEMLGLATPIDAGIYGLTREGQAALILLELTRPGVPSAVWTSAMWLEYQTSIGKWVSVDQTQWASGIIVVQGDDDNDNNDDD